MATSTKNQGQNGNRLLTYVKTKGYRVKPFNIIYLEGIDAETWQANDDRLNAWNDVRIVVRDNGEILLSNYATTEPGAYYVSNPMNAKGAARIAFGQHKDGWAIGLHRGYPALVQVNPITVHRDFNRDSYRTGDKLDTGLFAVNQHGCNGKDAGSTVDRWSAGCLVGKTWSSHRKFVELCRATGYKTFDTTVIDGSDFLKFKG